ncbi:2,3-bisphosphoglycerate-independent phosphoglycerate mutase [Capsicum chinense]|nr:2,3-bisphosphoglycerate-independent phosphoglycerate mutase [Capsicum chinense]
MRLLNLVMSPSFGTVKFGHVTFFWNGNSSRYFDEKVKEYVEIPSDSGIAFNVKPKMKALEIAERTRDAILSHKFHQATLKAQVHLEDKDLLARCLVGKFFGVEEEPTMNDVRRWAQQTWKGAQGVQVYDMNNTLFLFEFQTRKATEHVLMGDWRRQVLRSRVRTWVRDKGTTHILGAPIFNRLQTLYPYMIQEPELLLLFLRSDQSLLGSRCPLQQSPGLDRVKLVSEPRFMIMPPRKSDVQANFSVPTEDNMD